MSLTTCVLRQMSGMSVEPCGQEGADLVVESWENPAERYAVLVKGRIIPSTESNSTNLSQKNIDRLKEAAENIGATPKVAFVFVDEMDGVKKLRIFVIKLADILQMRDDPEAHCVTDATDGVSFCYAENEKHQRITEMKQGSRISYFEWQNNQQ